MAAAVVALCVGATFTTVPGAVPSSEAASVETTDTLRVGEKLLPWTPSQEARRLVSANGGFDVSMYLATRSTVLEIGQLGDGNFTTLWRRVGDSTSAQAYLTVRSDGNLVLYAKPGVPVWSSGTAGSGSNNRLVIRNDGNLVLTTSAGRLVWSSGTHAQTLLPDKPLLPGQYLSSVFHREVPKVTVTMQSDGNLVARQAGAVRWATNTTVPGASLTMRRDGNLVVSKGDRILWTSRTGGFDPSQVRPWMDANGFHLFEVNFFPAAGGGGQTTVFRAEDRPGETGRLDAGDLRYMTRGSVLRSGQTLASRNGYRLTMQANGNVVMRTPTGAVRWQTRTAGQPGAELRLTTGGRIAVVRGSRVLWTARRPGGFTVAAPVNLVMQVNGNLVAQGETGRTVWSTGTGS